MQKKMRYSKSQSRLKKKLHKRNQRRDLRDDRAFQKSH